MYNNRFSPRFGRGGNNRFGGGNRFGSHGGFGGRSGGGYGRGRGIKTIDPRFFVQKAAPITEEVYTPEHVFADFELDPRLKSNIISHGYVNPTPIQDQAIPSLLEGRDVIGIAATGTGKTAAFLIPLINKVARNGSERVLIVTPTRELAVQIETELRTLTQGMNIYSVLCIGGVNMGPQVARLSRNPKFVIGTPGRLQDLERHRRLDFGSFRSIVLDEVDRMLDMGFVREISFVISKLPTPRQSLFFSATVSDKVRAIMQGFLHDPISISIKPSVSSANVDQDIVRLDGRQKVDVLHELLTQEGFDKVLVFGRTKWGIEKLSDALEDRGFKVASIHGNKNQNQRQRALEDFKGNYVQILLATDVASRGIDINDVTHVINFDQPESHEDYIHRIGRTGRAGKTGVALTFVD